MITPKDMQICYVTRKSAPDLSEIAIWDTDYSMYGAGGHFRFGEGSMAGVPVDVDQWVGTHWVATETPGIAVAWRSGAPAEAGQTND